jgi:hypothetical protein
MGRLSKEQYEERIEAAEHYLIECSSSSIAVSRLVSAFKCAPRTASRWLQVVRQRWEIEGAEMNAELREAERTLMRRTLRHVLARGFEKNDLKAALGAAKQLRHLDGLDVPKELRLSGGVVVGQFEHRSDAALAAFLTTGRFPSEGS